MVPLVWGMKAGRLLPLASSWASKLGKSLTLLRQRQINLGVSQRIPLALVSCLPERREGGAGQALGQRLLLRGKGGQVRAGGGLQHGGAVFFEAVRESSATCRPLGRPKPLVLHIVGLVHLQAGDQDPDNPVPRGHRLARPAAR